MGGDLETREERMLWAAIFVIMMGLFHCLVDLLLFVVEFSLHQAQHKANVHFLQLTIQPPYVHPLSEPQRHRLGFSRAQTSIQSSSINHSQSVSRLTAQISPSCFFQNYLSALRTSQ